MLFVNILCVYTRNSETESQGIIMKWARSGSNKNHSLVSTKHRARIYTFYFIKAHILIPNENHMSGTMESFDWMVEMPFRRSRFHLCIKFMQRITVYHDIAPHKTCRHCLTYTKFLGFCSKLSKFLFFREIKKRHLSHSSLYRNFTSPVNNK